MLLAALVVVAGLLAWQTVARRAPVEPVAEAVAPSVAATPTPSAPPTTAPPATEATTEPIPAPTTEPPALGVPARPAETPEEVRAVYDELHRATGLLLEEPSNERLDAVISPLCNCRDNYVDIVRQLIDDGHRIVGPPPEVLEFSIRGRTANPAGWDLQVVLSDPERDIVSSETGELVSVFGGDSPQRLHVAIAVEDGYWKFTLIGLVEDSS